MKKINKFLGAIFAIVMMLGVSLSTLAHDFEVDGIYYNILDETAKTVQVSFSGSSYSEVASEYSGEVTIPSSVSYNDATYSVTSIGESAFRDCSGLTSVTIPNSVTAIGVNAFNGCYSLSSVNITDLSAWCKINFVNEYSNPLNCAQHFKLNGSEITNLVIPNDITEIKKYAFINCDGLASMSIPNSVTSIGERAFMNCVRLSSVSIPNSVTSIGEWAFNSCSGLKKIITLNPTPPTCASEESFYSYNYTEATLYVPKDSYAKYFIDGVWGRCRLGLKCLLSG